MGKGRAPCCAKVGLNKGSWTPEEDMRLIAYIRKYGHANWRALPKQAGTYGNGSPGRRRRAVMAWIPSAHACRGLGVKLSSNGSSIPSIGLLRCGKSCRLRWINYLCPDLKRGNFTAEEEETIIKLHGLLGNKYVRCKQRSDFDEFSCTRPLDT